MWISLPSYKENTAQHYEVADIQQEIMRAVDDIPKAVAQKINVRECSHCFSLGLAYFVCKSGGRPTFAA
jgi:hypothetical protein